MELFTKFREAIFLKSDSDLEKQLEELKKIKDKVADKEKIEKDIKLLEIGIWGENNITYELKTSNIGMYVLRDVTIQFEDLTAQIDFVVVTKAYTYLIECKNLIGNITVNNSGEFKRDYYLGKKNIVEGMYSPYRQAVRHKEILKKIWLNKHSKLTSLLFEKGFDNNYKPLVVLANSKSLLNIRYAPKEVKSNIVRVDNLIEYIKKDIAKYDKEAFASKKTMEGIANSLLGNHVTLSNNFVDKYEVINRNDEDLEKRMRDFRKKRSLEMNVPAYYVFTDDEMLKLIEARPKNLDELKRLNLLSAIKIKCHGKDIVDIINFKDKND